MSALAFSLGITYWPRRQRSSEGPLGSWAAFDHGALRAELGHIAELGFTTVRFDVRWAELQPTSRINTAALRGLERALDAAHACGLQAVVSTLAGSFGGVLHLPDWALGFRLPGDAVRALRFGPPVLVMPADQPAILTENTYRHEPVRDLYAEPEILANQRLLLHETLGNFATHPAASGWLLGADLGRVQPTHGARSVTDWWHDLVARAQNYGARMVHGALDPTSLERRDRLRPVAAALAGAPILSVPPLPPLDLEPGAYLRRLRLLHALTAGLLQAERGRATPVIIADLGLATTTEGASGRVANAAFGKSGLITLVAEEQQAQLIEQALTELQRAGAGGVWLARYADPPPAQWQIAPADRSWWARSAGIVSHDGREKQAAAAVRSFATRLRNGQLATPSVPVLALDPERYWHNPAEAMRGLVADWER
ncbi:MAG: hypothetical protein AB4911_01880 [Oscillochloridaceae bacterium umkhey_bin13]